MLLLPIKSRESNAVLQKFKKNEENVNFYARNYKFSQLFKIILTIFLTNNS